MKMRFGLGGPGPPLVGSLGPTKSILQHPSTYKIRLSWILLLHHYKTVGLLVEGFLALARVIAYGCSNTVIETRARPIRRDKMPSLCLKQSTLQLSGMPLTNLLSLLHLQPQSAAFRNLDLNT